MGNVERCQRPGCHGIIVDGICEDCGRPPVGKSVLSQVLNTSTVNGTATFATGTVGSSRTSSRRHTSRLSRGTSSRRKALGGGLVSLPSQPSQDPMKLVMEDPVVPERKRRCPKCEAKVNRTKGFCPKCGQEYSFEPSLSKGDIINEKFEVKGAIAFGGLGWIYLAYDNLLSRWVVLKGLLNAKDEASAAAAVAERQFLAAVKHPKIVGIYDFIQNGNEGYIVMEYVGGRSIESIRKEKGVLPVEEAISYILGILPAFSYLHSNGYIYCDFKPDNFMLEGEDVKLIDMGGVRKVNDADGDIYGTRGYMAPEADDNPDEVSDIYTIGRSLAVLIMDFKYQTTYEYSLPTPNEQPILATYEALYRFLLRAAHEDPNQRFQSVDEMNDQLYGVLREIVAMNTSPKPAESQIFTSDNLLDSEDIAGTKKPEIRLLPMLKLDLKDAACNELMKLSSITNLEKRIGAYKKVVDKFGEKSVEARFRLADAYIMAEKYNEAEKILSKLAIEDEFDWRVQWYRGKGFLNIGNGQRAKSEFGRVYFEMPGEIAPKLAIAFACEIMENIDEAIKYYNRVVKVDPNYTTACFGLARCLVKEGDIEGASDALNQVPQSHSMYTQARITLAKVLMEDASKINEGVLAKISDTIESISYEGEVLHVLGAKLLATAVELIGTGAVKQNSNRRVIGHSLEENALRAGAEAEYRKAAKLAKSFDEKVELVNMANEIRPVSLF
jgi:serine/threonine-protein kinase PknG